MKNAWLKLFLVSIVLTSLSLLSCTKEASNSQSGSSDVSPTASIPDPEGTILLKMRNEDNGRTYIENHIYITKANNLRVSDGLIAMLGKVNGLGNIARIPSSGWAQEVALEPGCGYVAHYNGKFYRIYVLTFTLAAETEGIIGAEVKYQTPFYGLDETPMLEKTDFSFDSDGGNDNTKIKNTSIIPVDIKSSESWCRGSLDLINSSITINCDRSNLMEERTATLTLTTHTEKQIEISVKQESVPVTGNLRAINDYSYDSFPCKSIDNYQAYSIQSNALIPNFRLTSDKSWCSVSQEGEYVYVSLEANYAGQARKANISMESDGKVLSTVTLNQDAAYIRLSQNSTSISADEAYVDVYLYFAPFNQSDLIIEHDDFIRDVSVFYQYDDYYFVRIFYESNASDQERSGKVKFIAGNSGLSATFVLNQYASYLYVPKTTVLFDKNQGNRTYSISCPADWTAESSASWCTTSRNDHNLTIRVEATTVDRQATITFPGFSASILVDQSKYATGDVINVGNVTATVLYTSDDVRMMYKVVGTAQWSTENVQIGANNSSDGRANMEVVKAISGWQTLYPAFAICDALNTNGVTGWYLPAPYELQNIENAGASFSNQIWSSWENYNTHAYSMYPNNHPSTQKSTSLTVMAVRRF